VSNQAAANVGDAVKQVVAFVKDLKIEDLPREVIEHTKLVLLDTIGAMLAASDTKYQAGRILTDFVKTLGGTPENPFSPEDIKHKFFKLSRPIIDESTARKIVAYIDQIEFQEDINSLGRLLLHQNGRSTKNY
jgi:2-methylcitrate dehydratase PrpD